MKYDFKLAAFADEAGDSLAEQISAMSSNGIEMLEIRGVDGKNIADVKPAEAKEIRKMLDDAGISVWSIGSPTGKTDINDSFAPVLDSFKNMIECAEILGAKKYRLFSFFGTNKDGQDYFDEVASRLERLCEAARGSGITLCHENEKEIYGESALHCLNIAKLLGQIKLIFDPANFIQSGVDVKEAWDMLEPYVDYVHIKDSLKSGDVVPAGEGEGCFDYILPRYFANGGRVLTLEPHLAEFTGLAALEGDDNRSIVGQNGLHFDSQRSAFDYAANALKKLLERL